MRVKALVLFVVALAFATSAWAAATETVIYNFNNSAAMDITPMLGWWPTRRENLYGTTQRVEAPAIRALSLS